MKAQDLVGKIFGRLRVVSLANPQGKGRRRAWHCQCSCGNVVIVTTHSLHKKKIPTRSCGCLQRDRAKEANLVHGYASNRGKANEFTIWANMIGRCTCPTQPAYPRYGGRGIKVHPSWLDFPTFLKDVGPRPSKQHSLERIDNNGDYEPGNVKWATLQEQARNKRNNRWLELNGETKCLAEWSELTGIGASTILARIDRRGWPIDKALTVPVRV